MMNHTGISLTHTHTHTPVACRVVGTRGQGQFGRPHHMWRKVTESQFLRPQWRAPGPDRWFLRALWQKSADKQKRLQPLLVCARATAPLCTLLTHTQSLTGTTKKRPGSRAILANSSASSWNNGRLSASSIQPINQIHLFWNSIQMKVDVFTE